MKQPKRLSRKLKIILSKNNMIADDYMMTFEDGTGFGVVHKDDHTKEYVFRFTSSNHAKLIQSPVAKE